MNYLRALVELLVLYYLKRSRKNNNCVCVVYVPCMCTKILKSFLRRSDKMEGMEESKVVDIEFESELEGIEERSSNDIVYHPHSSTDGLCPCLAVFLRDVFYFLCCGSRVKTRLQRETMNCNDNPRSREGSTSNQLLIMKGFDVYTQHNSPQQGRLQAPARMSFTNDKLIGSPSAGVSHHPRYRHHSISFKRSDGTPFSGNE